MVSRPSLPRLVVWLVSLLAPRSLRAALLDDLEEELAEIRQRQGRRAARRWLWRQLASMDWLRLRLGASRMARARRARSRDDSGDSDGNTEGSFMATWLFDLRSALRSLRRQPRFAASVIATVAVGIIGAATVFAALEAVLLRPLPYAELERLVALQTTHEGGEVVDGPVSLVNLREWGEIGVFDGVFAVQGTSMVITERGAPEGLSVARITPGALVIMGIEPLLGRGFDADEGRHGNHRVALLTHHRWQSLFEGDSAALGQKLVLDDEAYVIVGVLPDGVHLPNDLSHRHQRDLLLPLAPEEGSMPRIRRAVTGFARLAPGVSLRQAQQALEVAHAEQTRLFPRANEGWRVDGRTLVETIVGPFRSVLLVMMGAALLLLILASANLVNLMLAHWTGRQRELAVRSALGAGRGQLVRHLVNQGMVLGLAGGVVGVAGAHWLLVLFTRLTPGQVPRLEEAFLSPRVVLSALVVAGALGLLFGGIPALMTTGSRLLERVRGASPTITPGRWERRTLGVMVTLQVGLAVMLLAGAGLVGRSFLRLVGVDPGFAIDRVVTVLVVLAPPTYPDLDARTRFVSEAAERFGVIPGVTDVGVTNFLPYSGTNTKDGFSVNNWEPVREPIAGFRAVDAGYFEVMRIPVVRGRGITADDFAAGAPVAVISEHMERTHFAGVDPIGLQIQRDTRWLEIVGVVGDVKHEGPDGRVDSEWYAPYQMDPYALKFFVLRAAVPADQIVAEAREVLATLDDRLAPLSVQTMKAYLAEHTAGPRFNVATLASFALVAISIAALGLFGVIASSVAPRVRELGIRMTLGASAAGLRNHILGEGLQMAGLGVVLGLLGHMLLAQSLVGLLRGIGPHDPVTMAVVAALVLGVAVFACWAPARRAASVDPVEALRAE